MAITDIRQYVHLTAADIEPAGVGANEVRTWIAAIAAGNLPLETVVYEPVREWITGMAISIGGQR